MFFFPEEQQFTFVLMSTSGNLKIKGHRGLLLVKEQ
jgi:hypothetical protein